MTTTPTAPGPVTTDDQALKAKHAAMWASGSYPTVADEVVASLGPILVETLDIQPGQRVLDVAAGTGTSALPAARRGAEVTATDLTPELLDVDRAAAEAEGLRPSTGSPSTSSGNGSSTGSPSTRCPELVEGGSGGGGSTGSPSTGSGGGGSTGSPSTRCPELVEGGSGNGSGGGLTWQVADAEALPYDDAAFDVVFSCIGVMFAPHHQQAADELVRVCRPGGTIRVLSWTPEGFIGQLFAAMKPYAPPPPPGSSPAPLWGRADHVRTLFGNRVTDLVARQQTLRVDRFSDGAEFRDFFKTNYGPTIAVYCFNAAEADKMAALDADLAALGDRSLTDGAMSWEYLLVTARRV